MSDTKEQIERHFAQLDEDRQQQAADIAARLLEEQRQS